MARHRPALSSIRKAIVASIARDRLTINDIANAVDCSRSQVQRVLAEHATSYRKELRVVRIDTALHHLVTERHSARRAASEVGITADHLSVILKTELGLSTGQIIRARELQARVVGWARQVPPRAGTSLYYARRREWAATYKELTKLLGQLHRDSPLHAWAQQVLRQAERPDFRTASHRERRVAHKRAQAERVDEVLRMILRGYEEPSRTTPNRRGQQKEDANYVADVASDGRESRGP